MPQTYLFYDIETSGRSSCFDQILQFAAIRTDLELVELERYQIQIRLKPDLIPDPQATLVHQISIDAMQQGVSEFIGMQEIHALVNTPGTLSGGYNTLKFDDEFLRFAFYRNLLPPYTHQWANNCGRFDLYPLAMLYFLFSNETLQWPIVDDKPSLKLERLNQANQLAEGTAHTALADVEATLALARRFYKNRQMWEYAMGYFHKNTDNERRQHLTPCQESHLSSHNLGLLIGGAGSDDFFQCPVLSLGQHYHYKNQHLWLRLDKPELATSSSDTIDKTTWVIRKKAGEEKIILPFLPRFIRYLSQDRMKILQENLAWLNANPSLFNEIKLYHQDFTYPSVPEADVETTLYTNDFPTPQEEKLCYRFHRSAGQDMAKIANQFTNPTLRSIAQRILWRHYPEFLTTPLLENTPQNLGSTADAGNRVLIDYRGTPRLTANQALEQITQLYAANQLNPQQIQLLQGLENYILRHFHLETKDYESSL